MCCPEHGIVPHHGLQLGAVLEMQLYICYPNCMILVRMLIRAKGANMRFRSFLRMMVNESSNASLNISPYKDISSNLQLHSIDTSLTDSAQVDV